MIVVVTSGTAAVSKGELNEHALYLARSAERVASPDRRAALLEASRRYATEALRSSPPVRPWGARSS